MTRISPTRIAALVTALTLTACAKPAAPEQSANTASDTAASDLAAKPLTLSPDGETLIGLQTDKVALRPIAAALKTTGTVVANDQREAHVTTRVSGRVIRISRNVGDRVSPGETLAVIESVELGQAQSDYLQAEARYNLAKSQNDRQKALFKSDLSAQKEVQASQNQLRLAQIDLERSTNQLRLLGYSTDRLGTLKQRRQLDPTIPLTAPIGGTIVARHLTLGEMLEPNANEPAFMISDTSSLWVVADVYEKDLAAVAPGQLATMTTAAFPGRTWQGRVTLIGTALDKASRTAKVRIAVANADGKLKPEMFAAVDIAVARRQALTIPKTAVQEEGGQRFTYVKTGPHQYVERRVDLGPSTGDFVEVTKGLQPGETVVAKGSFDLKAQARKGSFGEEE
jgi:cobalt-zinc-cadmium efflux system membrane fusion protein